jgi:predicted HTH transcriptional regulator
MRSRTAFLIIAPLLLVSVIGVAFEFMGFGGRGQGQGRMVPQSVWIGMVIIPLVFAAVIFTYVMAFPELSEKKPSGELKEKPQFNGHKSALDGILRVLKEDEKKVVEALVKEEGTMLQKDIRWNLKLSRVKTHRILSRLAERGIVTAEKHYNTNKITLAEWLTKDKQSAS